MSDSVARAKEALDIGLSVVGIGAIALASLAWRLSSDEERLDRARGALALALATGAALLTVATLIVLVPLAWRSLFENRGAISSYLVAYDLVVVFIVGLGMTSVLTLARAARYLVRAVQIYRS